MFEASDFTLVWNINKYELLYSPWLTLIVQQKVCTLKLEFPTRRLLVAWNYSNWIGRNLFPWAAINANSLLLFYMELVQFILYNWWWMKHNTFILNSIQLRLDEGTMKFTFQIPLDFWTKLTVLFPMMSFCGDSLPLLSDFLFHEGRWKGLPGFLFSTLIGCISTIGGGTRLCPPVGVTFWGLMPRKSESTWSNADIRSLVSCTTLPAKMDNYDTLEPHYNTDFGVRKKSVL